MLGTKETHAGAHVIPGLLLLYVIESDPRPIIWHKVSGTAPIYLTLIMHVNKTTLHYITIKQQLQCNWTWNKIWPVKLLLYIYKETKLVNDPILGGIVPINTQITNR